MSDQRPTPETDNDTQFELAAWELLKEARELARELRDELVWKGKLVGLTRHQQALIAKAKEVLG